MAGKDSEFKQYPPLDSERVKVRLADLDRHRTERLRARTAPAQSAVAEIERPCSRHVAMKRPEQRRERRSSGPR